MGWFIGVDVGGTFTDFYAFDQASGTWRVHKRPSTPRNPANAIVEGLQELSALHDIPLARVQRLSHGTTVATNALLQRKGAHVALVTTAGFKDLIEIGRQIRPHLYSMQDDQPPPVVPRTSRIEVSERIVSGGGIRKPLTAAEIDKAIESVTATGAEACAICLLFSFLNPVHEAELARQLRATRPDLFVSVSSEVQPEFREYERLSTTVLNAYLQPLMDRYLRSLQEKISEVMPDVEIGINQSNGGLMSIERAQKFPVRTALSGPAAGAMGAIHMATISDTPNVVTLDMGGTSADVCLIKGYEVGVSFDRNVGGFPVRMAAVDINTVGAGGGSIAWFEKDGLLKVGPISAGADPGPACYGRGGTQATVTDANLVLGRLAPKGLLGGKMNLDLEAARNAFKPVAQKLGFSIERAAQGVVAIVVSNMVRAIRAVSTEKGYDARTLTLMPFGGAGPLHASEVARSLGIKRIIVPLLPGILCAQGLIVSDLKEDFVKTVRMRLTDESVALVPQLLASVSAAVREWFEDERIPPGNQSTKVTFDSRYVGQNYELPIVLERSVHHVISHPPQLSELVEEFYRVHEREYGYHSREDAIELVNVRISAWGSLAKPTAPQGAPRTHGKPAPVEYRDVLFEGEKPIRTPVYDRKDLFAGDEVVGPAIIDQLDATTVLYPGETARTDKALNIMIEVA